jgi:hypothetical protein
MKKVETAMKQLSNLYEFNQKLKSYKLKIPNTIGTKGQQPAQPDREEPGAVVGKVIGAAS